EKESVLNLPRNGPHFRLRFYRWTHFQKHEKVPQVERLLEHTTGGEKDSLNYITAATERCCQECQCSDGDVAPYGANQNDYVRRVIADGAEYRQQGADDATTDGETAILFVEFLRQIAVALG